MPQGGCQDVQTWDSYATLRLPALGRWGRIRLYFDYLDHEVFSSRHDARAVGFKMMYAQAQRGFAIPFYLRVRRVAVVHLIRWNHLNVLLSEEARKIRKYYHAPQGTDVARVQIYVEPETLEYRLAQRDDTIRQAQRSFQELGVPYHEISYEDLVDDESRINEALDFLAVETNQTLHSPLTKLNSANHRQLIANYDEVAAALSGTRFVGLLS